MTKRDIFRLMQIYSYSYSHGLHKGPSNLYASCQQMIDNVMAIQRQELMTKYAIRSIGWDFDLGVELNVQPFELVTVTVIMGLFQFVIHASEMIVRQQLTLNC